MLSAPQLAKAQQQLTVDWAPWVVGDPEYGDPKTPRMQCEIADSYSTGNGLIKNSSLAVKWWLKAAEQGSDVAQYELGIAFANGIGVPRDLVAAHAWFSIAWENEMITEFNSPSSDECRTDIEQRMTTEQLVQARRRANEWKERHGKYLAP